MSTPIFRVTALALAIAMAAGCNKDTPPQSVSPAVVQQATETPDGAISVNAKLFKAGDFAALMQNVMPPAKFAELKAEWADKSKDEPITDEDRQKFSAMMSKLTAADAETSLFAEASPKLKELEAQYQAQLPMYVNMGRGFAQNIIQQSQDISDEQKRQAVEVVNAIGDWAQSAKFTDQELLKQSTAIAVETARAMEIKTLDEARALDFDSAMKKGQIAFLGAKKILAVYGFALDSTLDSVKPTVISTSGDNAKVRIDYNLLGKPLSAESEMLRQDGRWYSKDSIEMLNEPATTDAPAAAETPAKPDGQG